MEVFVGPTFGIEVAASSAYARDHCPNEKKKTITSCLFDEVGGGGGSDPRTPDLSSDSSSSIGSPGDSDAEDEDDDVSSGVLACLGSIEDSLPIKRGLSNHYAGKSKSFGNLSDISSVKEVPKVESPFNKKRRLLLANKWSRNRKSSFYSWQNPNSMPLLALVEDDDEDQSENIQQTPSPSSSSSSSSATLAKSRFQQSNLRASFKSQSCYSLTDLQLQVEQNQ